MASLSERVINKLEERRQNLLEGNINCIPFPFANFREDIPGIEQGRYISITGATKSSKSMFASKLLFEAILYAFYNPDKLSILIRYFPLEETPEGIMERFMSFLLYKKSNNTIRVSPSDLRSTNNDKPVNKRILEILQTDEYQELIKFFEKVVIFSAATTPMGIKSIQELEKHKNTEYAITMFFVINATSVQLIPSSVLALRASLNSVSPSDIILPTILATLVSTIVGILLVKIFVKRKKI